MTQCVLRKAGHDRDDEGSALPDDEDRDCRRYGGTTHRVGYLLCDDCCDLLDRETIEPILYSAKIC